MACYHDYQFKPWEDEIIRQNRRKGHPVKCWAHLLPGRSEKRINERAIALGLRQNETFQIDDPNRVFVRMRRVPLPVIDYGARIASMRAQIMKELQHDQRIG